MRVSIAGLMGGDGNARYARAIMPQGSKAAYTDKQKRKAGHIEDGYRKRGVSKKEAESRAWATVNKEDGGGKKKRTAKKTAKKKS